MEDEQQVRDAEIRQVNNDMIIQNIRFSWITKEKTLMDHSTEQPRHDRF